MPPWFHRTLQALLTVVQIAIVLLAVAVLCSTRARTDTMAVMLKTAMLVEIAGVTYSSWRRGQLSKTPAELYQQARTVGPLFYNRLEPFAATLGLIALAVLAFR